MSKRTQGQRLLRAWLNEGHTQTEIAASLDVKQSSVSLWVNGIARPVPHYRSALSRLCGIAEDSWFTAEERRIATGTGHATKATGTDGGS